MDRTEAQELLREAFQGFLEASRKLELYYRALEQRVRELTEELERSRKERERLFDLFKEVLESVPCGIVVEVKGEVMALNAQAREVLGREGLPLEGPKMGLEELKVLDGRVFRFSWSPLKGRDGHVLVIEDVTEPEKWRLQEKRAEGMRAQEQIASFIAHELRTPLSAAKLALSLLEEELEDPGALKVLKEARLGLEEMEGAISRMLLLVRPERAALRPMDLREPIEEVVGFLERSVSQNGIRLELEVDDDLPVLGDPELMKHVLLNLVLNAVQAMPQGGTLRIEAKKGLSRLKGEVVRLTVEDTGDGIPPEHLPHIFKPFFSTRPEGTGLGLTVVHRIVEAHGGLIEVESEPGKGTRFVISLPCFKEVGDGLEGACCGR